MGLEYELKCELASTYKSATVDSTTIVTTGDSYGARVSITFTRLATIVLSETVLKDGGKITPLPNTPIKNETVKIVEFTAEMRGHRQRGRAWLRAGCLGRWAMRPGVYLFEVNPKYPTDLLSS